MGLRRVTALVIAGFLMVSCSDGEADSSEAETPAVEEITETPTVDGDYPDQQAVDLCLEAAKTKLANPDTAVFGEAYIDESEKGDDNWLISGNYAALGEDGVSAEGIWQCRVEYEPIRSLWLTKYIGVVEL